MQSLARRFRSVILIAARDASSGFAYKRLHVSTLRPTATSGARACMQKPCELTKSMHAEIPASSVVASTTGICIHLRRKQIPVSVTTTRTKSPVRSGTTCRPCGRSAYKRLHCTPLVSACETRRASCASLGASLLASRRRGRTQRASRLAPPSRTSPTRARRFARDLLRERRANFRRNAATLVRESGRKRRCRASTPQVTHMCTKSTVWYTYAASPRPHVTHGRPNFSHRSRGVPRGRAALRARA